MKIRKFFLTWLTNQEYNLPYDIDRGRFFNILDKDYLFKILKDLPLYYPKFETHILDFTNLEHQRYYIMDKYIVAPEIITTRFIKALEFCNKPIEEKRTYSFIINPSILNFIASSKYLWNGDIPNTLVFEEGNYLFIPSICNLPPKEIVLTNLNSLLLDLKDFSDNFSYLELLELVNESLEIEKNELDNMLMEFITKQILYYRTIYPISV